MNLDIQHQLQQAIFRWQLIEDGLHFQTSTSVLQYVRLQRRPAILKVALCAEERRGAALLRWWNGAGAVRVLALHENMVLLERACGSRSLAEMARTGQDDEASRIICDVAAQLHAQRPEQSVSTLP